MNESINSRAPFILPKEISCDIHVAVVIPIYKDFEKLTYNERLCLNQCKKILGKNYPILFCCPDGIDVTDYNSISNLFVYFDSRYFKSIRGYNELMLSIQFYKRFQAFQYILIYQLDAFVFEDQLQYWCCQGYDYIGAPWLSEKIIHKDLVSLYKKWKAKRSYKKNVKYKDSNLPVKEQFYNKVGNGGFSLRKIEKMISVLEELHIIADYYLANSEHSFFNEDTFWSLEVNREFIRLNIPDHTIAVHFSMEFKPALAFKLSNNKFPFGCHAWELNLPFWRSKFLMKGIAIN